jgi:hypothetical protein
MKITAEHPDRSAIIFTFMEPRRDGRIAFRHSGKLVDWWLRRRGEPFRWGILRDELSAYLSLQELALERVAAPEDLRIRYLTGSDANGYELVNGDFLCVAASK